MTDRTQVKYYPNGFVIKRIDGDYANKYKDYMGIDGDIWPIDKYTEGLSNNEIDFLNCYLNEYVILSGHIKSTVDVCSDIDFLNIYIDACIKTDFKIELLFCETIKSTPICIINPENYANKFIFIGFDYGYPGMNFYSCIYNDIKRFPEMNILHINRSGLFDTEEEVIKFILLRDKLKSAYPKNKFEQGEFIIYKLWKYIGEIPLTLK